jgi:hypothetical protein
MKIEKHVINTGCSSCGGKSLIFKTNRPITKTDIEGLAKLGFTEAPNFTQAGILYMDNLDLIVSGPIGSDRLQVKCKLGDCETKVSDFEVLLQQLE